MSKPETLQELLDLKKSEIQSKVDEISDLRQKIDNLNQVIMGIEARLIIDQDWYDSLLAVLEASGEPGSAPETAQEISSEGDGQAQDAPEGAIPLSQSDYSLKDLIFMTLEAAAKSGSGLTAEEVCSAIRNDLLVIVKPESVNKTMSVLKKEGFLDRIENTRPSVYILPAAETDISSQGEAPLEAEIAPQGKEVSGLPADSEEEEMMAAAPEASEGLKQGEAAGENMVSDADPEQSEEGFGTTEEIPAMSSAMEGVSIDDVAPEEAEDLLASLRNARVAS